MSKFNLSHTKSFSAFMGKLIPITWMAALPGDVFRHKTDVFIRTQPLLAPLMHLVTCRVHHFFVPNRLIWEDWEDFITGGEDGNDSSVAPTITINDASLNSLTDYLGVPTGVASDRAVSALPYRAYAAIYNEYFRDQQLQSKIGLSVASGADTTTNTTLEDICWEKDYFTSARPDTQLGDDVTVPLGDTAPVVASTDYPISTNIFRQVSDGTAMASTDVVASGGGAITNTGGTQGFIDPADAYEVDLSSATGTNINDLRRAFAIQRWQEARSMFGGRYVEFLRFCGVSPQDARLQRPEYLGGGKRLLQFSEVVATAETGTSVDVGDLKGHGIGAMSSNRYKRYIPEHGIIMSLLSVRPKTQYYQGIHKEWLKTSKFDYHQKELESIGQAAILNKELYSAHSTPDGTFGYQDRYDEYRRMESSIAGDFKDTLDFWNMARSFSSDPALNDTFVTCNPTTRVWPATSAAQMYIMAHHNVQAIRNLSPRAFNKIL